MNTASRFAAALALLIAPTLRAQDTGLVHTPTPDQCRSEAALWAKSTWGNLAVTRLWTMNDEMDACVRVGTAEAAHDDLLRYAAVQQSIAVEYLRRMQVFLDRHHLYKQFELEDEAGVR